MSEAALKKHRGSDPAVKDQPHSDKPGDAKERALEQGLEESMAGSDPVSITQPSKSKQDKREAETAKKDESAD